MRLLGIEFDTTTAFLLAFPSSTASLGDGDDFLDVDSDKR